MRDLSSYNVFCFDFDGVFTDNRVYIDSEGKEIVRCDRGDGLAVDFLRRYSERAGWKLRLIIVSKERNRVVAARASKLGMECHQGIDDKVEYISNVILKSNEYCWGKLVYFGNDLNDYLAMSMAGLAVCPKDAHPAIKKLAEYISEKNGGDGFIRDFIEGNTPMLDEYVTRLT